MRKLSARKRRKQRNPLISTQQVSHTAAQTIDSSLAYEYLLQNI